jgi:hypothetical protein
MFSDSKYGLQNNAIELKVAFPQNLGIAALRSEDTVSVNSRKHP